MLVFDQKSGLQPGRKQLTPNNFKKDQMSQNGLNASKPASIHVFFFFWGWMDHETKGETPQNDSKCSDSSRLGVSETFTFNGDGLFGTCSTLMKTVENLYTQSLSIRFFKSYVGKNMKVLNPAQNNSKTLEMSRWNFC